MTQSSPPVRVAIVGAGGIASGAHLPALESLGGRTTVVAIADLDQDRARTVAANWGIPAVYGDIDEMLEGVHPELVLVCTPPVAHRDAVVKALDAGAWVLCEKPPTLSLAEYDDIAAHEGDAGPYASYVFQHRFGSAAQRLRRQIGTGELGSPLVAVCHTLWYRAPSYFEVPWRGKWATEGGGPTMGHGIHQMDLLLSLLGDWTSVIAQTATLERDVETEDVSFAIVTFESGAVASVVNSLLSPRETSYLRFDFTDATVEVEHLYGYDNSDWTWTPAPSIDRAVSDAWPPTDDIRSSHAAQLTALLDAMAEGRRPPSSGADGRRVLELIAGIYRSAATAAPVARTDLDASDPFYSTMSGAREERAHV
ncbi:oxidoreductase [Frondihabitans sucicola]|uniref:Oxidoreductase n=1 Tax=Frondihabitans sucicola TaxID=1268041 RepID=A0ABM8GHH1_9MICO|nr:Gfo/Idh/MocA family oxidoreductase [Frondihabitans sucicola]BDZ47798.1 oxidoreductase [Frondihabitans sucicola]BDZ52271.1 oxidoreductase [Frondihabitans sucicola]